MIVKNPLMFNGKVYKKDSKTNEKKLKDLMEKLIIESDRVKQQEVIPRTGGNVWKGQFRKQELRNKPKTFKL